MCVIIFYLLLFMFYYTTLCNTWFWLVDRDIDWSDFSTIVYGLPTFLAALVPEICFPLIFPMEMFNLKLMHKLKHKRIWRSEKIKDKTVYLNDS